MQSMIRSSVTTVVIANVRLLYLHFFLACLLKVLGTWVFLTISVSSTPNAVKYQVRIWNRKLAREMIQCVAR